MVPVDKKSGRRRALFWLLPVVYAILTLGSHSGRLEGQHDDRHHHYYSYYNSSSSNVSEGIATGRRLLEIEGECMPPAINDYPSDFMTQSDRQQGGVVFHIFLSCYMCYALAIVCDDYFIPSLEGISDALNLPSDVAGATFMAAGTSAPELFMSLIGVFITEGDIGVGTIIGSAVFNILAVVSVCGLLSGKVVPLDWWPLSRDCIAYTVAVIALILVLADEKVYWYEAMVLVIMFFLYITTMYFNSRLEKAAHRLLGSCSCTRSEEKQPLAADIHRVRKYSTMSSGSESSHYYSPHHQHHHDHRNRTDSEGKGKEHNNEFHVRKCSTASTSSERSHGRQDAIGQDKVKEEVHGSPPTLEEIMVDEQGQHTAMHNQENASQHQDMEIGEHRLHQGQHPGLHAEVIDEQSVEDESGEGEEGESSSVFRMPSGNSFRQVMWVLMWPVLFLFFATIPDCRKERWKRLFPLTFLIAITYIGVLSYLISWMVTIIGHTFNIPDTVMGLTFLAAGTSVPEAISSVIVCRQGFGNMAISNSVGSNVFDILFCLGLPWLVKASINGAVGNYVNINSKGIEYSAIALLTTVVVMFGSLALNRFKLDKRVGLGCLLMYAIFLVISSLFELNVFGVVNLPTCAD